MPTVAIIIPYFGQWPKWSDLFFASCKTNSTVDFLIYSNQDLPSPATDAKNIHFTKLFFEDYCQKVSHEIGINFVPSSAKKLCDLKPFYGYIHRNELSGYDFWGYGDVDLVWGDLRSFYTDEILNHYDVLSTHADRISGHLALIRNNKKYISKAFRIKNWQEKLENEKNMILDEQDFTLTIYPFAFILWKIHNHLFSRLRRVDEHQLYIRFCNLSNKLFLARKYLFAERNTTPWNEGEMAKTKWEYKDGHIFNLNSGKEIIYLHFFSMKSMWNGDYYHPSENGARISFNGIEAIT